MRRIEFFVALEVQIALVIADRKDVTDLWPDADHSRLEVANSVARSAVARELIVEISDQANMQLLGQKLRGTPVSYCGTAARLPNIPGSQKLTPP